MMEPGREEHEVAVTMAGDVIDGYWSVGVRRQGIGPGDRAFLLRQHRERGLVGVGEFTSVIYEADHWDESDRYANYASVRWTMRLNADDRLPVEDLHREVPGVKWDRLQASGTTVSDADARKIAHIWQQHVDSLGTAHTTLAEEIGPTETFLEGAATRITVNRYERDPAARAECLAHWGTDCSVCGFDFAAVYGSLGDGFIHVHHVNDLSTLGEEYQIDPITDLRPVCPNCHAMLHRERPAMNVDALRALMPLSGPNPKG